MAGRGPTYRRPLNGGDDAVYRRPLDWRQGLTLLELLIAMTIMVMVVGAMGGLTRTVQQGFEYSEGYGLSTQHARVVLDRIAQNVAQATANEQFPGCLVVAETVNTFRYPDTLVLWRPSGAPVAPNGLPRYNELLVYCPNPAAPKQFVEMTAPSDMRTVPAASDQAGWQAAMAALKKDRNTKMVVLSDLLRTCSMDPSGFATSNVRGAARFESRLRPSDADWASYTAGTITWMNLPWVQGIYGSQAGLRQVWVRMELQLMPGAEWVASNPAAAQATALMGSATLYYQLKHP